MEVSVGGGGGGGTQKPPPSTMEVPRNIGPIQWCLGCPQASERRLYLGFTVPNGIRNIIVRIQNGLDDEGDRMMDVMVGDPNGRILMSRQSTANGWEEFRCPVSIPGKYFIRLRDNDTNSGGQYPGNSGYLKIMLR